MISAVEFGARLARFRKREKLTQAQIADAIGIGRTTLVAIEKGERQASDDELVRIAEALSVSLHELLDPHGVSSVEAPRFRAALGRSPDDALTAAVIDAVVALAQRIARLERALEIRFQPGVLGSLALYRNIGRSTKDEAARAGKDAAERVRGLLALGDEPVRELATRLELEGGFRIFGRSDLPATVSGFLVWGPEIGPCVAVNTQHSAERQLWTLAHELGHFIDDRERGDTLPAETENLRWTPAEVFADTFARELLMPERTVRKYFLEWRHHLGRITVHDIVMLSNVLGVSFQALMLRVEELGLVKQGLYDQLRAQKFRPDSAREALALARLPGIPPLSWTHTVTAFLAFREGRIAESELARVLETDRVDARARFADWDQDVLDLSVADVRVGA